MTLSEFSIGLTFFTGGGEWRCTDVGTRTIAAIHITPREDPSWYNGPPYAVSEHVFDEFSVKGCALNRDDFEKPDRTDLGFARLKGSWE